MDITTVPVNPSPFSAASPQSDRSHGQGPNFLDSIKSFLRETNDLQHEAGEKIEAYVAGEEIDLHDVMIARQKAGVSFELVMEIRNKILEAYTELMRMPV